MNTLIAIPSNNPGGLDASIAQHFGHCDLYTIVEIRDNVIDVVSIIPPIDHQQGGCMAPVQYLANKNVKCLISGGMGFRPLAGFEQVGIDVYYFENNLNIQQTVDAFIAGNLSRFSKDQTCGGGSN